jgi:deoxyadenosine/deoxycytidine kinase
MKRLKKLSKNKKPIVIFIYGPIAVGKLTVANILSKKLGYKLSHNHMLNDLVYGLFNRQTFTRENLLEKFRYHLLESVIKEKINFITTHCYMHNFISKTGLSDPKYMQTLEKKLTKLGAKFYPIHLKASSKELLRRVGMSSRKKFRKLKDKKIMRELVSKNDWQTSPRLKNNLVIDNTKLSPNKVSDMIIKHFKLKS